MQRLIDTLKGELLTLENIAVSGTAPDHVEDIAAATATIARTLATEVQDLDTRLLHLERVIKPETRP